MIRSSNTSYRQEQVRAYKILRELFPPHSVMMEYNVKDVGCILDLAIIPDQGRFTAIRMMGEVHTSSNRISEKDEYQKQLLEGKNWIVVDFIWTHMPNLWNNWDIKNQILEVKRELGIIM